MRIILADDYAVFTEAADKVADVDPHRVLHMALDYVRYRGEDMIRFILFPDGSGDFSMVTLPNGEVPVGAVVHSLSVPGGVSPKPVWWESIPKDHPFQRPELNEVWDKAIDEIDAYLGITKTANVSD